jgi:PAS domain S-box-containing protein
LLENELLKKDSDDTETTSEEKKLNEELKIANKNFEKSRADLSKLTKALEEKVSSKLLLNAIPQQVWTSDLEGSLDYVNQVVCDDFGYSADQIVGHGWKAFIHPEDVDECLERWSFALQTGQEYSVEFRLLFSDGNYHWHLARAVPLIENDKIILWLGTNTNIEAQKANEQRKDEFLSIASHELKTPLTSLKGYTQLIQRANESEKITVFLDKSAQQLTRLEKLIIDLLDVTKINAGKMSYNMEPFSFLEMLQNSVENTQLVAPAHKIILEAEADIVFNGDAVRLEQVILNFLSNAIKYSPGGEKVIVSFNFDQKNILVSIKDFGIGIAESNLHRLFNRYYRIDNTAMRFEGLGLGLYISSEILKRHHGSFWIESEENKGSTFSFRLPIPSLEETGPIIKTDTYYRDSTITISFNNDSKCLDVDWIGYHDFTTVKAGGMVMLEMLKKNSCHKVLNDNRNVLGTWSEASDWAASVWFPLMELAGLKYFAWILPDSAFSQLSAKKSVDERNGNVRTQFFSDDTEAIIWLLGFSNS